MGNNVHFIYRHSIYNELVNRQDIFLFEFVDRALFGLFLFRTDFIESKRFFAITDIGIDEHVIKPRGPRVICQTFASSENPDLPAQI